jgi:hypothetical protein
MEKRSKSHSGLLKMDICAPKLPSDHKTSQNINNEKQATLKAFKTGPKYLWIKNKRPLNKA